MLGKTIADGEFGGVSDHLRDVFVCFDRRIKGCDVIFVLKLCWHLRDHATEQFGS